MKLSEVKVLDDGKVYLKGGYYLEFDAQNSKAQMVKNPAYGIWVIKRLMDDDTTERGEATITSGLIVGDVMFKMLDPDRNHPPTSELWRPLTPKHIRPDFYAWVEKKLPAFMAESTYTDDQSPVEFGDEAGKIWMMGRGFYMEKDLPRSHASYVTYTVKRLMDDSPGFADATRSNSFGNMKWKLEATDGGGKRVVSNIGMESAFNDEKAFTNWVRLHLRDIVPVNEDLGSDAMKARKKKAQDAKPVWLHRLKKDGSENKMHDARSYFDDERAAKAHHDNMVKLNPGSKIEHHMYSYNGDETMKTKLSGGKVVMAKGGILGNKEEDPVTSIIDWLDSQGSAAGMWMEQEQREKLAKLVMNGTQARSFGVDIEKLTPEKADAKIEQRTASLKKAGWVLFDQEDNGDYVDMVFIK
jgi:hypothetical protein